MLDRDERSGRETRLLALVIVVALAALLILARYRFPAAEISAVRPQQGPLERLVARSTYEDLAASVASLVQRSGPSVVVLQIESIAEPAAGRGKDAKEAEAAAPAPTPTARLIAGARLERDLALVHLPRGFQVTGGQGLASPPEVLRVDEARQIALVRAPSVLEIASALATAVNDFPGFSYVGVVEAAIGGITAKPVFLGRADMSSDPHWPAPIIILGGSPEVPAGSLLFALDGRFIGLALPFANVEGGMVVPPATLAALAAELERGSAALPAQPGKAAAARGRSAVR